MGANQSQFVYSFQGDGYILGQLYGYFMIIDRNTVTWRKWAVVEHYSLIWENPDNPLDFDQECNVFAVYKLLYAMTICLIQGALQEVTR